MSVYVSELSSYNSHTRSSHLTEKALFMKMLYYSFWIAVNPITNMTVKHNHAAIRMTVRLYGGLFITLYWNNTFGGVGHLSLFPLCPSLFLSLFLIPYSAQPFRSVLITGVQLELAFQFLTLQLWKSQAAGARFLPPPPPLLSALLVWLNMPDTFTSLHQHFAMQCDSVCLHECEREKERKKDEAITVSRYKASQYVWWGLCV